MSRIALTVFGTAGDILPCIPVAIALENEGHEVTFVTPRWLGLLPRMAGLRTVSVGDGREKRALTDAAMYTTRFDGMASWRHCMTDYVYPVLSEYYDEFLGQIRRIAPTIVITTALGYWGALAAAELDIPWSSFHLYPQLFERSNSPRRSSRRSPFARPLAQWLVDQESRLHTAPTSIPVLD